jgi:hypothetical protein
VTRYLQWSGSSKPAISEQWNGHTLDISQHCPAGMIILTCNVSYTIAVPDLVTLRLGAGSGNITVSLGSAPDVVNAQTDSGNVTVEVPRGTSYDVQASTDSGSTSVTVAQDPAAPRVIIATTDSGNVTVEYN